ncbi:MAG: four helix bundle protein [Kiritimatiellae bacterium]|jgi:four helix bundle protein|nr:four helix bundle protein [Kiritimatiellia bacterium]
MKTQNIIQEKSFLFAIRIVNTYKYLNNEKKEFVLSKQLLRSGTSISANLEEALGGQSTADFVAKLSISYKEAREPLYWIRLLHATDYLSEQARESLTNDCEELCKIMSKHWSQQRKTAT